jgi:predicted enzyme related to lactoylglutathione lyase
VIEQREESYAFALSTVSNNATRLRCPVVDCSASGLQDDEVARRIRVSGAIDGRFVWYDLLVADVDAAAAFYRDVLGWGTERLERGGEPYVMLTAGERAFAGLASLSESPRHGARWLCYVGSTDVETTAAKVDALGGSVLVSDWDQPPSADRLVFADPRGAIIAACQPSEHPPAPPLAEHARISWHDVITADVEQSLRFYQRLFDWELTGTLDLDSGVRYPMFGSGETSFGGVMLHDSSSSLPLGWMVYITVDDLERTLDRVESRGGTILRGPIPVPGGGRDAECLDQQGAAFGLYSPPK